ncbi:MAG: hypothetical protein HGA97_12465 [Chlorobiaceae bacterium]|nr:hypothetical protein [Chlorobiaceae bacterium]
MVISDTIPSEKRSLAENTLEKLHLRDDERVIRQREQWYRLYCGKKLSIDGLEERAPLIARAIRKQQRSNAEGN